MLVAAAVTFVQLMMPPPGVPMPPARYRHEPPGGVQIVIVPDDRMIRGAGAYTYSHPGRKCVIYIAQRYVGTWLFEKYRIHEIGHCNGWPANHPD